MVDELAAAGYTMKTSFELEFYLFNQSFADIRRNQYRELEPVSPSKLSGIYRLRNGY